MCNPTLDDLQVINTYLKHQESTCFSILYDRYARKIFSKALGMLKDEFKAEDATQEIFAKIFLNLHKFNGRSKFSTWVYSVTYNYCIDYIRKTRKERDLFAGEMENPPEIIDEEVPDEALLQMEVSRLKHVLTELNDGDRAILLMKYKEELPIKEIARMVEKQESAVKMQLKRAKEKVKRIHDKKYKH